MRESANRRTAKLANTALVTNRDPSNSCDPYFFKVFFKLSQETKKK